MRKTITTHVLDMVKGGPARGIEVRLYHSASGADWREVAHRHTDEDGRVSDFVGPDEFTAGSYRLDFDTAPFFAAAELSSVFGKASLHFEVANPEEHYHIPLLLSPNGYSTYRGS